MKENRTIDWKYCILYCCCHPKKNLNNNPKMDPCIQKAKRSADSAFQSQFSFCIPRQSFCRKFKIICGFWNPHFWMYERISYSVQALSPISNKCCKVAKKAEASRWRISRDLNHLFTPGRVLSWGRIAIHKFTHLALEANLRK